MTRKTPKAPPERPNRPKSQKSTQTNPPCSPKAAKSLKAAGINAQKTKMHSNTPKHSPRKAPGGRSKPDKTGPNTQNTTAGNYSQKPHQDAQSPPQPPRNALQAEFQHISLYQKAPPTTIASPDETRHLAGLTLLNTGSNRPETAQNQVFFAYEIGGF